MKTKGNQAPILRMAWNAALLAMLALLNACNDSTLSELDRIRDLGEIIVLTHNSPTTYYEEAQGLAGMEYELVTEFAEHLGVTANFRVYDNLDDLYFDLKEGVGDFAAAGLVESSAHSEWMQFTPEYQKVTYNLVYRYGTYPPLEPPQLAGRQIEVLANSREVHHLRELKARYPKIDWIEVDDKEPEELLEMVFDGLLEFTVVDSNTYNLNKPYYPELRIAMQIGSAEDLAWGFRLETDTTLYDMASRFIDRMKRKGEIGKLLDRYYGAASVSNPVNMTVFHLRVQNRLPKYQTLFEEAARKNGLDWRLLASIGYQESFWNPKATSPTGVRGIMMLTLDTAKQLGVKNRLDPAQSIEGGARYIREMMDRLPKDIPEPDRTWLALAAYNVGLGHLQDAQRLVSWRKGNPNEWEEVQRSLPLLSKKKWYTKTTHGFARGIEPVRFVIRVRNYYDALVKLDEEEKSADQTEAIKLKAPSI